MTSMRPGPSRHPKVSPRSQHRFGFRSPPRLEHATSSSRPLPPDALSVRPALAFQVPIRSLSHGCSAVLRGRISRSPRSVSCPSFIFTLRTLSLSSHIRRTPSFFSSRSVLCCDADDPFPPAPRCRSRHHVPSSHWGQGPKYPPGICWIHWEYRQQVTPMCPVGKSWVY